MSQKREFQTHLDRIEGYKSFYDLFKHVTTLSTGSVLILTAFLEKFFKNPEWKLLIGITLALFIISIISSLLAMIGYGGKIVASDNENKGISDPLLLIGFFGGVCSFILGVTSLVVFAVKNFY